MTYPKKFKKLLELRSDDIDLLDFAWLVYAVCACEEDSCSWQGWIPDGVFRRVGAENVLLPSIDIDDCPNCGKPLYRTGIQIKLEPASDQTPSMVPGVDYEIDEIEYTDD